MRLRRRLFYFIRYHLLGLHEWWLGVRLNLGLKKPQPIYLDEAGYITVKKDVIPPAVEDFAKTVGRRLVFEKGGLLNSGPPIALNKGELVLKPPKPEYESLPLYQDIIDELSAAHGLILFIERNSQPPYDVIIGTVGLARKSLGPYYNHPVNTTDEARIYYRHKLEQFIKELREKDGRKKRLSADPITSSCTYQSTVTSYDPLPAGSRNRSRDSKRSGVVPQAVYRSRIE